MDRVYVQHSSQISWGMKDKWESGVTSRYSLGSNPWAVIQGNEIVDCFEYESDAKQKAKALNEKTGG